MHQIILQLNDTLSNIFPKGVFADAKKLQYLVLLQCWISGLRPTRKPSPWWVSQRTFTSRLQPQASLQPNPQEQSHSVPALAVLLVLRDQESPSLLETSFSAAVSLLRDPEPEPLVWCAGSCTRHRQRSTPSRSQGFTFALGRCAQVKPHSLESGPGCVRIRGKNP